MPSEFAKGDLVELKSGGPKMTVVKVERQILGGSVTCAWFHEDKLQHGVFEPETMSRDAGDAVEPVVMNGPEQRGLRRTG